MRPNPARHHAKIPARLGVVLLSAGVSMSLLLAASCRSSLSGKPLTPEEELQQKFATLSRQEQIVSAELALARSQAFYLAIDLTARKMDLKVQGHSLRSFAVSKLKRTGGKPFVAQTWVEQEAKPLQVPARSRVVPGSGEATTASVATQDPWGPQRMPSDYDLVCKGFQVVEVRSLASMQSHSRFTRWIVSGFRQARDWTRDLWSSNSAIYRESIELWVSEDDAKLLFWSLPKQFSILILNAS